MKKALSLILSLLLVLSVPAFAADTAPENPAEGLSKDIVILFTSDVHCGVDQGFGFQGLALARAQLEAAGNYTLLVDDGDAIQGEPLGTMTRGEAVIDLMNAVGYDLAIPGNHEFDYGTDRFLELAEKADFPYLSCNFNYKGELVFAPYAIKEFDSVKIAFIGVTTPKTLTTSTPRFFQDENGEFVYGFFGYDETGQVLYDAVQSAADSARGEGADYVFVMAHLGNEDECRPWTYADILANTNGIDGLLDGHSHDTDQVTMKNKDGKEVFRSAVGTKMGLIGTVTISAEDGSIRHSVYSYTGPSSAPAFLGLESPVDEALRDASAELNDKLAEVVAKTTVDLIISTPERVDENGFPIRIIRRAETNLGDLVSDAFRAAGGADAAIVNGGAIRVSVPAGKVTMNDILKVCPFGNMLCVSEVTGQQILDALEWGTRTVPSESGGFPQVSGITYEIHTYLDSTCTEDEHGMFTGVSGEYRVKNVMVGGEPLDPEKTYTLAGSSYIFKDGGDGYTMFRDCPLLQDEVKLDNQVLIDYIRDSLGGVIGEPYTEPYGEGRIVAVEEPPERMAG